MVEIFSHLCIYAHWPIVTSLVECSRIYHMLSNLLSMLRNGFVALSSKLYFLKMCMCPCQIYLATSRKGLNARCTGMGTVLCLGVMVMTFKEIKNNEWQSKQIIKS